MISELVRHTRILEIVGDTLRVRAKQAKQNEERDENVIRNVAKSYQEAYNQQDASKLAAQWTSDAIYINSVTGESAEGGGAIEKLFKDKFAEDKKRHLEITIKNIEFPNVNEAIENGVMKVTLDDEPAQQVAYQAEYIKQNGKWMVKAIKEIELQAPSSNFEHLKDLAWLVGKWEDSDDNVDILFDNQWDKYKNFTTQHFQMKVYGISLCNLKKDEIMKIKIVGAAGGGGHRIGLPGRDGKRQSNEEKKLKDEKPASEFV